MERPSLPLAGPQECMGTPWCEPLFPHSLSWPRSNSLLPVCSALGTPTSFPLLCSFCLASYFFLDFCLLGSSTLVSHSLSSSVPPRDHFYLLPLRIERPLTRLDFFSGFQTQPIQIYKPQRRFQIRSPRGKQFSCINVPWEDSTLS